MSSDKNELLFKEFEINYNNLSAVHRQGNNPTASQGTLDTFTIPIMYHIPIMHKAHKCPGETLINATLLFTPLFASKNSL
ncbi:hypothetical protein DPMN_167694 [Dreissena polymorpha]|uniref:Thg1 C-terminal domain-containing protein n=1 Tax=Dreissena polymorpha TaxID=45954 RepID=A0A9D4IZ01_DREPO|nr:hypothetical protein DPMN_167694 [Dreissena polymorpha]